MPDKERIAEVLKFSGMNVNKFAKAIKVAQSTLAVVLHPEKNNKPGMSMIKGVLELYPDLNPKWLILGEGEMWLKNLSKEERKLNNTLEKQVRLYEMVIKDRMPELAKELGIE